MAYVTPGTVAAGDVATAAAWNVITNDIIQIGAMSQGVFTNEAARDAAITSPTEGMHAYLTASTVAAATGTNTMVPSGVQTIYNGSVWVCVTPIGADTPAAGTTTSSTYTASLSGSPGTNPSVTLVTGTTAYVSISNLNSNNGNIFSYMNVAVSGATTLAANDTYGISNTMNGVSMQYGQSFILPGLTAGTNTFTLQYKSASPIVLSVSLRKLSVVGIA